MKAGSVFAHLVNESVEKKLEYKGLLMPATERRDRSYVTLLDNIFVGNFFGRVGGRIIDVLTRLLKRRQEEK